MFRVRDAKQEQWRFEKYACVSPGQSAEYQEPSQTAAQTDRYCVNQQTEGLVCISNDSKQQCCAAEEQNTSTFYCLSSRAPDKSRERYGDMKALCGPLESVG